MEPVTTSLGLLTFGAFLKSVVGKIALSSTEAASKQLIKIIRENLREGGSLPPNHDLKRALEHSLAQAANAFACAVGHQVEPELPWLQTIQAHYQNGTLGEVPLTQMRDHPERAWVDALIKEAKSGKEHPVSADFLLDEGKVTDLFLKDAHAELKQSVHDAFTRWLAKRVQRGKPPDCVAGFIKDGWPIKPDSPKNVTFYQAFCAFFREQIKHNTEVERIFLAETVSKLARDITALKGMTAPTMDGFQSWLGDQLGELKDWLEKQFGKLHKRHDEHDRKLDELKAIIEALTKTLAEKGVKLADLSQEELERELAQRVPTLSADDLHRLIGYARFKADFSRIIKYAPAELIGREAEMQLLHDAWSAKISAPPANHASRITHHVNLLTFVALGGEGKTSLVAKWAAELAAQDWPGCDAVFAWSFYSQGTREQTAVSADLFLAEALAFFGDEAMAKSAAGAHEKGTRLAKIIGQRRSLLILDGLEPLQYAPTSPTPGELKDQGLAALLKGLAAASHGLCVVTTRYALPDLRAFLGQTVREEKLTRLARAAGVRLLKTHGVTGSDRPNLPHTDDAGKKEMLSEFEALVEDVDGHALTLNLLGSYLCDAHGGDIRKVGLVKLEEANAEEQGGHAFHVMDAYVTWLGAPVSEPARSGTRTRAESEFGAPTGPRALALLRLMGLFDRPATADCLAALWKAPAIAGLTEPLIGLSDVQRNIALKRLEGARLLTVNRDAAGTLLSLDAHPLLREYFAQQLRVGRAGCPQPAADNPTRSAPSRRAEDSAPYQTAWRAAHKRLYEHLCATTQDQPDATLEDLQPLYQAVAHGCQTGLQQEACDKVYFARIQRGNEAYSVRKLGAFGSDLGAAACFFEQPWSRVSPALTEADKAWLLNNAAFHLRALGRLTEALEPMRAVLEMRVKLEHWENGAIGASNLSELELTLGEVAGAVGDAEQSVTYADRSGDAFWKLGTRTTHADALHQAGRRAEAEARFREAEQMQAESQPAYPLLYSLPGFRYCDLLLTEAERAAWGAHAPSRAVSGALAGNIPGEPNAPDSSTPPDQPARARVGAREGACAPLIQSCRAVSERAAQTLKWANQAREASLLDIALNHLTLGRAALYAAVLSSESPSSFFLLPSHLSQSVSGLRRAGQQQYLPHALLTRAWQRSLTGLRTGPESAQSDLDEAWEIAARGPMPLFMADIHLYRARLFFREAHYPFTHPDGTPRTPQQDLADAGRLIVKHGYLRRLPELEDAEKVMLSS